MKKIIIPLVAWLFIFVSYACDDEGMFKEELYKKLIYIVSDDTDIFPLECNMETGDSIVYFSIASSGTRHTEEDTYIEFMHDSTLFRKYNYSNFDIDTAKYIHFLSSDKYRIPAYNATLYADSEFSYTTVPIIIHPENLYGLSPDSMYVINLKLSNTSKYEINQTKDDVMCRIYFENKYARMKKLVNYSMKGYVGKEGEQERSIAVTKNPLPLTKNSIRLYVGDINPATGNKFTPEFVNSNSIEITIKEDKSLEISAYDKTKEWLEVEMLTPPVSDPEFRYTNDYEENYDQLTKMPAFKMYYRYRNKKDDGSWDQWVTVKEVLLRLKDPVEK